MRKMLLILIMVLSLIALALLYDCITVRSNEPTREEKIDEDATKQITDTAQMDSMGTEPEDAIGVTTEPISTTEQVTETATTFVPTTEAVPAAPVATEPPVNEPLPDTIPSTDEPITDDMITDENDGAWG